MRCLVSGLVNVETSVPIEGFPIAYEPVRYLFHGITSHVSGVGYNVASALRTLGAEVRLFGRLGPDLMGDVVRRTLTADGLSDAYLRSDLAATPQSVILFDPDGKRQANTDLKDLQEAPPDLALAAEALTGCDLAVFCNVNFSRALIPLAREREIPIATDVHALADLEDGYNRDFLAAADILFMSDERLPCPADQWLAELMRRFAPEVAVVGMGSRGALLAVRGEPTLRHVPAVATRPVVNTVGAGDALFSSFLYFHAQGHAPHAALERAVVFAGHKIGESGGSRGFARPEVIERLVSQRN